MLPQNREDISYYMRSELMRRYGAKTTTLCIAIYCRCYQNVVDNSRRQYKLS